MSKKYTATIKIDVLVECEIKADSIDDALRIGKEIYPSEVLKLKSLKRDSVIDWENSGVAGVFES